MRCLEEITCKCFHLERLIWPNSNYFAMVLDSIAKEKDGSVTCAQQLKQIADGIKQKKVFAYKCERS